MSDEKEPQVIKFEPPAQVRLLSDDNLVLDVPTLLWGALEPGTRAAIPNPWKEGLFLVGEVHGLSGQLLFVVGESFGQLEHREDLGWVCTGLVQQKHVWNAVGNNIAGNAQKKSFTERLTRRAAKGTSGTSTK